MIDLKDLRAKAERYLKAIDGFKKIETVIDGREHDILLDERLKKFHAAWNPQVALALLDRIEKDRTVIEKIYATWDCKIARERLANLDAEESKP